MEAPLLDRAGMWRLLVSLVELSYVGPSTLGPTPKLAKDRIRVVSGWHAVSWTRRSGFN